jgi:hypothetical protein
MQVPMKDRLSFKRLLMKAEDLRKSSYRRTNFNSALDKIDAEDKQTYASSRDVMVKSQET